MLRQPRPLVPFTFPFLGQSYAQRILNMRSASLIADWQLGETSGTNAANAQGTSARDGTYTNGPTLNATTFTDSTPAPSFDGSNDFVNVYSTSLNAAFLGSAGTAFCWAKVSGSSVWTDGAAHTVFAIGADNNNRVFVRKETTNNQITLRYVAGGTSKTATYNSISSTDWISIAVTWDKAADSVITLLNGSAQTFSGLGTYTGALSSVASVLAAGNTSGTQPWSGYLKYMALWNVALSTSEIAALATV